MRLTKKFCALVSSFAAIVSAQVVTQTPPPAIAPAGANAANDDAQLREALRRALQGNAPAPASPVTPTAPAAPAEPFVRTAPIAAPSVTTRSYSYPGTNVVTTNVTTVSLSLEQTILLALENNRDIQVERYSPIIADYDRRALYGYYDPVLGGDFQRVHTVRESGGFNENTGKTFDTAAKTDTDIYNFGLGGYLPTGMRYDINHNLNNVDAVSAQQSQLFTNRFDIIRTNTWNGAATASVRQPLLKNFWIDDPRLQIKLRRRDVRISALDLERFIMDIINQVEKAYYALAADRELVGASIADVGVKKQFFDEQHRRVEVGSLAPLDETLAKAELALAELNLITVRKNEADAEAILKGLIQNNFANHLNTRLDLTDRLLAIPAQLELFDAFKEAVEKRPDLQAERLRLEKLQIQLKYDFNQLFPSLDVFATWGFNGLDGDRSGAVDDITGRRFPQDLYGVALSFPLTFWRERNNIKSTKNSKAQEVLRVKALEDLIIQNIDAQVRLLRTTWETIPLRRAQTAYEEAALEAEKKKLDAGKSTSFNVLQIASDLTRARSAEIETLRIYNQAISELNFLKGTTLERWRINPPPREVK